MIRYRWPRLGRSQPSRRGRRTGPRRASGQRRRRRIVAGGARQARTGADAGLAGTCRPVGAVRPHRTRASTSTASSKSDQPLQLRPARHRRRAGRGPHGPLPRPRRRRLDTPIVVHDPTRENVLAHQRVNETVMREHTVIPMSFGTVFKTDEDIIELLRSAYDAFNDVLEQDAGQVRVRPQGALGSRPDHPGDRGRGRGHPPAARARSRRRRGRPTSRACSTAA